MITPITSLDEDNILNFWNRKARKGKQPGRLDLVVNIALDQHYLVPKDQEHKDFVPTIPCKKSSELVPYWMQLRSNSDGYSLLQLVVGASSYEAEHGVTHTLAELALAHQLAWGVIARSPVIILDVPTKSQIL